MQKLSLRYIILPLTFLLFFLNQGVAQVSYEKALTGKEDGIGFVLNWSTSASDDIDYFVVERAHKGQAFASIGTVKNKQDKGSSDYSFNDFELGLKDVQYRLKEISIDGRSSHTEAITLHKQFIYNFEIVGKQKLSDEVFQVSINSLKKDEIECRITNNMGDILMEELKYLEAGLNDLVYDLTSELDGTYTVVFKQKNVMETAIFKKEVKEKKGNVAKKKGEKNGG